MSVKIPADVGNRLDFEEGGQVMGCVMNQFKPQAAHVEASKHNLFVVADLDEAQMKEFLLVASKQIGMYPKFIPIPAAL